MAKHNTGRKRQGSSSVGNLSPRRQRLAAKAASLQQTSPRFSQAAIEALRETDDFRKDTARFDKLKRAIKARLSPRDLDPILKAGAKEDELLTHLAFVVDGSCSGAILRGISEKSELQKQLADKLERLIDEATVLAYDPECDGRFWLAVRGLLNWDEVPRAGDFAARVLSDMRALAQLLRERSQALGDLSRPLKKHNRNRDMRNLVAYVHLRTNGQRFDKEIAYLLAAAYRAIGKNENFTEGQIRKFRERHLPKP